MCVNIAMNIGISAYCIMYIQSLEICECSLVNGAYPSGSSSVDSTRAVALVDKLPWSLDVKLTADR